jgi:mannan endo-1,4-beta-mannosidase
MKKLVVLALPLITLLILTIPTQSEALVDSSPSSATLAMHTDLTESTGVRMYFGQHEFKTYTSGGGTDCYRITMNYPKVLGIDYRELYDSGSTKTVPETRAKYLDHMLVHDRNNGYLMLVWHMKNWVTGGNYTDESGDPVVNVLPGGTHRTEYLAGLDDLADFLNGFNDKDGNLIPVLLRLYHEADNTSFWWAQDGCTNAQFISLWQDMVTYLRDTKGVSNVLYCYTPLGKLTFTDRYPGDDYVDIIGIDGYDADGTVTDILTTLQTYSNAANDRGKVAIYSEGIRALNTNPDADFWSTGYIDPLQADPATNRFVITAVWRTRTAGNPDSWGPDATRADASDFNSIYEDGKIQLIKYSSRMITNTKISSVGRIGGDQ